MTDTDLCYTSATDLAVLIANGDLSPVELMRATIDRIESLNSTLNAICTPTLEQAMDTARRAEAAIAANQPLGPLHGIPTTIKDLVFTRGVRTMMGSHIFADRVPDVDAVVVTRLNEAGAISLGKTTVPEFGWKGCSNPSWICTPTGRDFIKYYQYSRWFGSRRLGKTGRSSTFPASP